MPYLKLLDRLIACPSPSRDEAGTATILEQYLRERGIASTQRTGNNVYACQRAWQDGHPVVLLGAHHDTVHPSASYTRDPYTPSHEEGRIYGLGANDDGGSVCALSEAFIRLYDTPLSVNLILALTAEEEISGRGGMDALLPHLPPVAMGLVGEPTGMQAAIGERGLVVLDGIACGQRGHAARNEGINALYIAIDDILRLRNYRFERTSPLLGDIKVTTTQIEAGRQHNVVPDECRFVVDVRTTDAFTNEEVVSILQCQCASTLTPRSTRLRASAISADHPLAIAATALGSSLFISPTMSDMALMPFPTLKMGPGESARSHTADEYIEEREVAEAVELYTAFLTNLRP